MIAERTAMARGRVDLINDSEFGAYGAGGAFPAKYGKPGLAGWRDRWRV